MDQKINRDNSEHITERNGNYAGTLESNAKLRWRKEKYRGSAAQER